MLPTIITICFATCYLAALALQASRQLRSGVREIAVWTCVAYGWLMHSGLLVYRAVTAESLPLCSAYDWYLLAAWALVGLYLYISFFHPQMAVGLFVLPLVLGLVVAAQFAAREPFAKEPAAQAWGLVHGVFLLLGTVAVLVGFAAGLMYLLHAYRLKHK